ncbi:putative toll-like receptor, P-loop containing nucleoside triphosphate hydrolase [Rosa chinensis]|uniref:Putative toll-like receptor, P-loop containing nucleoside triphosphate hydrolase n=1 Tax=Rosa chinensis TaxID=74649 RepID=A0A2P6REJ3_ROSCH|nr:disease resistance protein RPV1 [Rosa chinensis]XP_024191428.1 disease resistance protein RPV1 [Rosa chinensis]XP_024191429.1 disease resistance protein RPV1 [Rosa chinensis]XP_024191430.1 disease resistance protein RPV1 [Rosa chinensis]XP_024191431.1 disease resistance protein RPV1 [Rosa chinensis]XP_024191432.1 disease resistance protein RPV1 [Rosa chinensis]XP_024191433.1 disease resistance protein RPV1 [Rosa chinensis]XP_024191434.1 disease resistance protein RPV1 [Rosa chinensis]XP_
MASSSQTSSSSLPSSSAPQWKHDVFLSFRGEDTRKGIVSSLYHELKTRGIQTFMDDQGLQQGMPISPSLLTAIEESRCAVVLLSPNYASSTWCLDELAKILQCSEAKKTLLLPIFYNVDPSHVRHQKGSFAEAFTKHEERYRQGNDDAEKVNKWRAALTQVANLSGLDSNKFGSDRELVQRIVELVRRDVRPISIMSSSNFEAFESTRKAMKELMEALEDDEVAAIGVYGMGGVGKTTMVKHVGAQAQKMGLFDRVIMAVVSQTPDTRNIQGALADLLGLTLVQESDIGRADRLQTEILGRKKILIILDDIWKTLDLSSIGIPSYNYLQIRKSKLLFTTRRSNVCHTMGSQAKIHLNILSEDDAWNLFLKKARRSFQKSSPFYEVARKVARECAGLPVALIAVARALGDKDFKDWKLAARQLEMSQPANLDEEKDVFKCIKLSYDYLDSDDAKSCFLLCCLFPEDYDIRVEDLMSYGFGTGLFRHVNSTIEYARVRAHSVTRYLKASCLLLDGTKEGYVRMHDVIRDMAISIALSVDGHASLVKTNCHLKDWSMDADEGYSAISLIESNTCKLPNKLVCSKLQILLLQKNDGIREISKTFFQSPNDLRVLDLRKTGISSLPPSFSLLARLQALHLDDCESIIDISLLGKLKKLEILSMRHCDSIKKFPKEIGNLTNLRMLDLTGTRFKTVPSQVISRLYRLEVLYMRCYFGKWGCKAAGGCLCFLCKNASFDELIGLPSLNTLQVSVCGAERLPQNVEVNPNWDRFCIIMEGYGTDICRIYDYDEGFPHRFSRTLITVETMNNLPDWFISVVTERTDYLWYRGRHGLTNLLEEHDCGRLHGLKYLCIESSEYVEVLLNTITWTRVSNEPVFENLEELEFSGDGLEELCVGELPPGSLRNLKKLMMGMCPCLVKPLLPSKLLHRLESLEELCCSLMKEMKYVFGFEGHEPQHVVLTRLRMISLESMDSLINIWDGPAPSGIFQSLKIISLVNCRKLEYLFTSDVARCLLQLEDVVVQNCFSLDRIIEASEEIESNRIVLPQLKNLVLKDLPKLTRLSSTSSSTIDIEIECPTLERLYVSACPQLSIPASGFNSSNEHSLFNWGYSDTLRSSIEAVSYRSHFPPSMSARLLLALLRTTLISTKRAPVTWPVACFAVMVLCLMVFWHVG